MLIPILLEERQVKILCVHLRYLSCVHDVLISPADKMLQYDEVDADTLQCFHEMALANLIFYAMKEGSCSELSARMTAMDSASKNAGKEGEDAAP